MAVSETLDWRDGWMLSFPAMDPPATSRIRFGEFEADLRSGELRKDGHDVRLAVQPFQLLTLLLKHPGELVTREELRQELWPADTFVDFDVGLNSAIRKLREALSDSAEHPTYVETLPRRGYRLIVPVSEVNSASAVVDAATTSAPPDREGVVPHRRRAWLLAIAAMFAASMIALFAFDAGGLQRRLLGRPASGVIRAIAVLPLENLTGDPNQEYFADGMTDALITDLAQISALRVISRTSSMRYKGAKKPLPEIARELNVDAMLEGSVVRSGSRVRVDVQLIHAPTDRHLWARSYQRESSNIVALQSDVAQAIASEIAVKLQPQEQARLAQARPINPEAYEAYLKGLYFFRKRSKEDVTRSVAYFDEAIAKDPTYAPAYAGLANAYTILGAGLPAGLPFKESGVKAKTAAMKAVELDDTLAEAHTALALIKSQDGEFAGAEKEFQRALQLNPGHSNAHLWYSNLLESMDRVDEALREVKTAQQLDPVDPSITSVLGIHLLQAGQNEQALEQCRKAVELDPHQFNSRMRLALVYQRMRRYDEAMTEYKRAEEMSPGNIQLRGNQGYIYALTGRKGEAEKILEELKRNPKVTRAPGMIAMLATALGRKEEALSWLERGYEERDLSMFSLKAYPFDPLRSEPRFQELVRRMELYTKR